MNAAAELRPMARIIECSEQEYFDDPCDVPSLSQSIANVLLRTSPLHAWNEHPRLGGEANADADDDVPEQEKEATLRGKIIHKLLLGKGAEVEVINVDKYSTNASKAQRDDAIRAGRLPIKIRPYSEIVAAAQILKSNLALEGINLDDPAGESEVAIEFMEEGEHGLVTCRARLDRLHLNTGVNWDLKKIRSADDETCSKHVAAYGYDVQWITNTRAIAALRPGLANRVDMLFVFMEDKPPYAVNIFRPSPVMRETGRLQWEKALLLWEHCLRSNRWPAYGGRVKELDPPKYYVDKVLGKWEGTDLTDIGLEK